MMYKDLSCCEEGNVMQKAVKRIFDLLAAIILCIVLTPLFLVIAILVRSKLGAPVLFKQKRPGKNGVPFTIYKFRTMAECRSKDGKLVPDEERLTDFGRKLRESSLDELPELFNVVKGDMSLVGPRPLLMDYMEKYNEEQARRHEVRPGITGWAQINGRNAISWEEKLKFDIWYIDHWSLWLDFKILLLTIGKVWRREGISQEGKVTVDRFQGTNH